MVEQAGLSTLRERVGRTEVEINHQTEKLREHDRRLEQTAKQMAMLTERLSSMEYQVTTTLRIVKWGGMTVITMILEGLTGTFKAVVKIASVIGGGS